MGAARGKAERGRSFLTSVGFPGYKLLERAEGVIKFAKIKKKKVQGDGQGGRVWGKANEGGGVNYKGEDPLYNLLKRERKIETFLT